MTMARSVADVLADHVVLEYEAIDRMYLNVYPAPASRRRCAGVPAGPQGATVCLDGGRGAND
jgi:hypothetical protein